MIRLQQGILLFSLATIALSNPLFPIKFDAAKIDRYNPLRPLMDALCTGFETSFCREGATPAIVNHIVPEDSPDNARSVPPLCEPSNFRDYRNFVDNRPFESSSEASATKQDCCITCYDARDCLSWKFDPTVLQCTYFTATSKAEDGFESDVCPLGVNKASYEELPGYPIAAGSGPGHNYGPCTWDAPLGSERAVVRGIAPQLLIVETEDLKLKDPSFQQEVLEL